MSTLAFFPLGPLAFSRIESPVPSLRHMNLATDVLGAGGEEVEVESPSFSAQLALLSPVVNLAPPRVSILLVPPSPAAFQS